MQVDIEPHTSFTSCVSQVFQEEMGVVKSYNLKPGGDKIPVTKQNRKGESTHTHRVSAGLDLFITVV